ncbi:fibronectin type III domain-containing protein [Okeanomitos corallinicola TIOX110]|uniref:Fibronectin type III domain-containing protein n=1 Tax=Okeanomitos corallinicola TIOX110 TaxID=3133117 RepID=A0ABZ2URA0_9CYAN
MATIYQTPRLQLGNAPLDGYAGSETDQFALVWQTTGSLSTDNFIVEYRPVGTSTWTSAPNPSTINTGVGSRINHTVTVTGVNYNTDYEYRVRHFQGSTLVETHQEAFKTRLPVGDLVDLPLLLMVTQPDPDEKLALGQFRIGLI